MEQKDTFVYNLIKDGRVVYVGITNNPLVREVNHRKDKDFDYLKIVTEPLPRNYAEFIEAALIQSYGFESLINGNRAKLSYLLKHNDKLAECPICESLGCGMDDEELKNIIDTLTMEECVECGKVHKRHHKNPEGLYICKSCYDKKYLPVIECAECGKKHKRNNKKPDGSYICLSCYRDLKAQEAGYINRFDATKKLGIPFRKIRWGNLPPKEEN